MRDFQNILKHTLLALLMLNAAFPANGQQRNARFQHLTIEEGLPQNMVDCMLQDRQGFLWFGTWNGLCRYDGYTFEVFNNGPSSLGNNFVYDLLEDPLGNLWIGTQQGLYVYQYDQERFIRADTLSATPHASLSSAIHSLALHQDSVLLISSELGLSQFNLQNAYGHIKLHSHHSFGTGVRQLNGSVINTLLNDRRNNIWVGTNAGVTILPANGQERKLITHEPNDGGSLSSNQVLSLYEDSSGNFWIGTEYGLNRYTPTSLNFSNGTHQRFFSQSANPESLVHNAVMDILEDNDENLIIATLGGLSIMTKGSQQFINYTHEYQAEHSLSNDFINCLLKDEMGNIWIGTERGGINVYNTHQNTFEHFEYKINDKNSLSYSTTNSIYEDSSFLWIGTAGGGLNRYDKQSGTFHHFRHEAENSHAISSDFITSIHRDQHNRLWVGTWGSGLNRLMNERDSTVLFERHQNESGLVSNFISSIVEDHNGNLWLGTLRGLVKYNPETDIFETVFSEQSQPRITEVGCLLFDADQTLWAGTRNGLFRIQLQDSAQHKYQITQYKHNPSDSRSISGNYVISLLKDASGNLWFGTYGQGVNQMHSAGDSVWFTSYNTTHGLSNNIIFGIQQDNELNLWLSTDYGLSRLNPETKQLRNFYIADGLLNNQYYWSASYKNQDGKLYFGGMNGLDAFYPEWINEVSPTPRVVITDIKLLNESVVPGKEYQGVEVLTENALTAEDISLSYKEKIFGIEFSSLNYQEPGLIRYAYILEGFEKDWNYVSSDRRYASYTNLKPGNYTFKVKASGSHGEFSAEPTEIHLHISPPFWDTLWFKVIGLLAVAGLVFGYIRFRTYALKRQKIVLERQVKDRTERVNQQKDALAFQAIQLLNNNRELEEKQTLIAGQNHQLEQQNREILSQRDELINLNRKLKLVSQLKLSFFTNVSHEFRTPLTLIIGPIEKLIREHRLGAEAQHTLSVVNRNAQRLLHLVNQIMDFRKIEQGRMELKVGRQDIHEFCTNIFRAFEPLSEIKKIQFHYSERDLPSEVWFDAQKMENIIYNLLSNAFKYTPNDGTVVLEVKGLSFDESQLKPSANLQQNHKTVISIRVSDSGIGISEENLPLVFKRFYRIESEEAFKVSGSGIGLAITEELINTHHGDIFVESELGKGSVFEIQFPCLKGAYETEEVAEKTHDCLDIHQQVEILKNELLITKESAAALVPLHVFEKLRPTVLVVEDNADLRMFIAQRLNKTYNILEAADGEVGIQLAEEHNPALVISDVMMPKTDGLALCNTLKNNLSTSHIPIILLTAKSTLENQIEGLEIGADDYLPKPFNFELLEARIQNLLRTRNQLRLYFQQSANFQVSQATTNRKDQRFLEQAIKTVEDHLEDPDFGVQSLVKSMSISRSLLHKKLTALTTQSTTEFINHLRMKRAQELLRQNELNVSEIAYAVGYNDPKYFSRVFNKHVGQSPTEFLKESTTTY
uniref:histidine kinase n=1 Tax=Roseihalotalea indica TaxID=2867963 RepID=A0AA49GKY1_9BACT|nr:two-component regulator propeller domain-containing protein [Tunicatimonas sp. TK19036]